MEKYLQQRRERQLARKGQTEQYHNGYKKYTCEVLRKLRADPNKV